jgi:hypothetical protein
MQVRFTADGRTSAGGGGLLVVHNERLADPLDSGTQALAALTGKRRKTLEDHAEIGRREWYFGAYTEPRLEYPNPGKVTTPDGADEAVMVMPTWNLLRSLQDGGKRHKRGPNVLRAVTPLEEFVAIEFDGLPMTLAEMWQDGRYSLRKGIGVRGNRTMRTRPQFPEWSLSWVAEVDLVELDFHTLGLLWQDAGRYYGLGEMRPILGRFTGTLQPVGDYEAELAEATKPKAAKKR